MVLRETSSAKAASQGPNTSAAEATRQMLTRLWQKNEALFRERLRLLSNAAAAALENRLGAEQREFAAGEAHKLVGSLGMFGYPEGSVLARAAEDLLNDPAPVDGFRLGSLVSEMHRVLPL